MSNHYVCCWGSCLMFFIVFSIINASLACIFYRFISLFQMKSNCTCEQFYTIHFWSWLSLNVTVGLNNNDRDIDLSFINYIFSFEVNQKRAL